MKMNKIITIDFMKIGARKVSNKVLDSSVNEENIPIPGQ
jgi:hypothetical protein